MARIYDCSENTELLAGMRLARAAIGRGELVVIPTDTVYGVAADAFTPRAVQRLLDAKGRTRNAPPPVLIPDLATLDALASHVPVAVRDLVAEFWPGALTIILPSQPSLLWDLGDTHGTVALRMPANPVALELLAETGPLAVSSANLTGQPAADTAQEAEGMLGNSVTLYLDGGRAEGAGGAHQGSTIIDATGLQAEGGKIRVLRSGVISEDQLRAVIGDVLEGATEEPETEPEPDVASVADAEPSDGDASDAEQPDAIAPGAQASG